MSNFWPDARQSLLLQACLAEDEAGALDAWQQWQACVDLDRVDAGTFRLLPLLAWRLLALKQSHPMLARLHGCLRQSWAANQRMLHTAACVVSLLAEHGVPSLLFKGVALDLAVYPARGLRPMLDVDIAVPRGQAREAWDALLVAGWQPTRLREQALRPDAMAVEFTHPRYGELDMHFALFPESIDAGLTQLLWDAAQPVDLLGHRCLALCPTDLLLHVSAHGLRANDLPPIRWVADAVFIIRSQVIDWQRFIELAGRLRCRLVMEQALRYLVNEHKAPVPAHVMTALAGPHGRLEVIEYRYERCRGFSVLIVLGQLARLHPHSNVLQLALRLPAHLQRRWNQPTLAATAWSFCVKAGQAARRAMTAGFRRVAG